MDVLSPKSLVLMFLFRCFLVLPGALRPELSNEPHVPVMAKYSVLQLLAGTWQGQGDGGLGFFVPKVTKYPLKNPEKSQGVLKGSVFSFQNIHWESPKRQRV